MNKIVTYEIEWDAIDEIELQLQKLSDSNAAVILLGSKLN